MLHDQDGQRIMYIVHQYCQVQGLELCGRLAKFRYYNSDAVIRSAKTVGMSIRDH